MRVDRDRAWVPAAAVGLLALENVGVLGALLFVKQTPALVLAVLLVKFPFCAGLLHRRHGAFMVLMLWEATTFTIAALNPALDLAPRALLLATSALGLALLGMTLPAFPPVHLPHRADDPGPEGWR